MTMLTQALPRTPLHSWIAEKIGIPDERLSREAITCYQLQKLRETIRRAQQKSRFYLKHLASIDPAAIETPCDLTRVPFTTAQDLANNAPQFVCVSQDEISRVVTIASSGTSGLPKRVFFSTADQEDMLDFFAHGVSTLASPGDRMLIALPDDRPGSVGAMLAQGIERFGVHPVRYGLIADPQHAIDVMSREGATSIIGFPVQILLLGSLNGALADSVFSRLTSIVLCSDYVSPAIVRRLRERAGCEVFQHYGMTETGLGGGVDCRAHEGYHLRETDLQFEIVNPRTGEPVPDGTSGEVVFSTLTREAMPLIRYRTGDISSFASKPCDCGTSLRTLHYLRGRINGSVPIGNCGEITLADLEDALFALPEVIDIASSITLDAPHRLTITLRTPTGTGAIMQRAMRQLTQ
ncbi:MAG TPA: AMP-binding protein, partial [Terriglobales bacterium]